MAFGLAGAALGVILILIGIFLVFFFPAPVEHQSEGLGHVGIVFGLILLVVGGLLVFL